MDKTQTHCIKPIKWQNKAENDIKTNISAYNALEYGLGDKTQTQCIKRVKWQNKAGNDIKTNISAYNALEYGLVEKTQTMHKTHKMTE